MVDGKEFPAINHQLSTINFIFMAYDPTKPVNNAPVVSAELRNQFAGLKTLIDARPHRVDDVNGLGMSSNGTYDPAQLQAIADKLDELIDSLKRA